MLIVESSEIEGGTWYVETKNLDGETNLKMKSVPKQLIGRFPGGSIEPGKSYYDSHLLSRGVLNVQEPNNRIYKFDGNLELQSTASVAESARSSNAAFEINSDRGTGI